MNAFLLVIISIIASITLSVIFGGNILKSRVFKRLVLEDEQRAGQGYQVNKPSLELTTSITSPIKIPFGCKPLRPDVTTTSPTLTSISRASLPNFKYASSTSSPLTIPIAREAGR